MKFSTADAVKVVAALGIKTTGLTANQIDSIAHDATASSVLHDALQAYLMNRFAPEVIAALPESERARLANKLAPQIVAKQEGRPSQWQCIAFGAELKPCVRVICPACQTRDGFLPLEDRGITFTTYPTVKEQMDNARTWKFKHCGGREEAAPETTLLEFERRITPFCEGHRATAADMENAYNAQQSKLLSRGTTSREDRLENPPIIPTLR